MSNFIKPIEILQKSKRLVIKVGTSVLTDLHQARVTKHCVQSIASEVTALWRDDRQVVVVTSGAIGVGMGILGMKARPSVLAKLQAAAATGQGLLMQWYTTRFEEEGIQAAQILLTRDDFENRKRYLNARATLQTLLDSKVVPIVNENDTVSVEEIRFGDNDILSAHVAALIHADLLVILSDVDKLVGPPTLPTVITEITPDLERLARGTTKAFSTGGMKTKLEAARIAMASGIPMILANGRDSNILVRAFFQKEFSGTWFLPRRGAGLRSRQRWLASARPKGLILVDSGAREALVQRGRSLLASGVHEVEGNFRAGDLVSVAEVGMRKQEFARGVVGYSRAELEGIKGLKSEAITQLLGRKAEEVIHRNSLVILRA